MNTKTVFPGTKTIKEEFASAVYLGVKKSFKISGSHAEALQDA